MTAAVEIPDDVRAAMYAHARETFPDECCGYLVGPRDGGAVDQAVPCTNAQRGPDRYGIDGRELLAFARSFATERPARVVYHSHTNGQAYFSATDRAAERAAAYEVQHLVVGVTAERVVEAALFVWDGAAHVEIDRWSVG